MESGLKVKKFSSAAIVALLSLYLLVVSFLVYSYKHAASETIFDLHFWIGPLVKNIVTKGLYARETFRPTLMPLVPFFLAAIAFLYNNLLFAYFVKNAVFFFFIFSSARLIYKSFSNVKRSLAIAILVFVMSFPQFILHTFSIEYGEGYIIALVSVLFSHLLVARRIREPRKFLFPAIINALLFLTKASVILLTVAVSFFYYLVTKNVKVFIIFISCLMAVFMCWGFFNLCNTGNFAILSSFSGYNFYKGNNEFTLSVYPERSLDLLSIYVARDMSGAEMTREGDLDRMWMRKAFEFIRSHPLEEVRISLARFYSMFFKIGDVPDEKVDKFMALKKIGNIYMLIFRMIFIFSIWFALKNIFSIKGNILAGNNEGAVISIVYLGFITAYSLPYLLAFAYERHVMPLVPPTIMYLVWGLNKRFSV